MKIQIHLIENKSDLKILYTDLVNEEVFLYSVSCSTILHPVIDSPSIIFARGLKSKNIFIFCFEHADCESELSVSDVCDFFNSFPNKKFVFDKKGFCQLNNICDTLDVNILSYLANNEIIDDSISFTSAHQFYRQTFRDYTFINKVIPINKHLEKFEALCGFVDELIENNGHLLKLDSFTKLNNEIVDTLIRIENSGIHVDAKKFHDTFTDKQKELVDENDTVYSQYNIFTSTGRPSNKFGGINFAALNKSDDTRLFMTSRFGKDGKLMDFDFTAFHPHLIADLIRYDLKPGVDIYKYLASYYFNSKSIDSLQAKKAKELTFQQLYGNIQPQYKNIPYFKKVQEFIDQRWDFYKKWKYIETPIFNRQINENMLGSDANANKVFNFLLQAYETEVGLSTAERVLDYLEDKKSKLILYTYDSMLIDFHKDDGKDVVLEIKRIMMNNGKFPIKIKVGDNYKQLQTINL